MRTTDLKEIIDTLEQIRGKVHPDLDRVFLEAVVRAEEENPEDDTEAVNAIETALKAVLASRGMS
jgi:hypothetical protein